VTTPVSFRITTYYKRKRNEAGLTQKASIRIDLGETLNWVLDELPDEAYDITHQDNVATLVIDWNKVPEEIRSGGLR
jgi:hypothetical protein